MEDEAASDHADEPAGDAQPLAPALTAFVLMSGGAALMLGAVFGTELVREPGAHFTWARLGVAAFGLVLLLAGLAWFVAPPERER